jgi:glycosyltransferase involved in cell wall biosynthesis
MRFLMICMQYPLGSRDSYLTTELADALVGAGHEVEVLLLDWSAPPGGDPEELISSTGVRVLRCSPRRFDKAGRTVAHASKFVLSGAHLARIARTELDLGGFDAAIAWMPAAAISPLIPMLERAGIRHRILFIWDFFPNHYREIGRIPGGLPYLAARAWERRLVRRFTTIFCSLPGNEDYLRRNYPLRPQQQVRVTPVWCDPTPRPPVDRTAMRRRHDLPADRPIAVFGGQLVAGRGFEQMLAAADDASHMQSPLLFLFVGAGRLSTVIRERADARANVRWLPPMDRASYLDLLGACDVGMVATVPGVTSFSIPSKTLDYLRAGLPVMAAVEAGNDFIDILHRYRVGAAVPFGDAVGFRREAERLATDPQVRAGIRAATRRCLDEVFDVRHAAREVLDAVAANVA